MGGIRRRDVLGLLGGAAAWPVVASAQQRPMPVIGFLNNQSPGTNADRLRAFHQGLKDAGFIEGENVAIEYRWAENQIDQIPVLAADLVSRQVALIATAIGPAPALAAMAATKTIPIVFAVGEDPVKLGLVANLARPGRNMTGVNFFSSELVAKRLELLRVIVPAATRVAVLVNSIGPTAETTVRDIEPAARAMGLEVQIFPAGNSREIDTAFATIVRERHDALYVGNESFFNSRRVQLVHRATLHKLLATYSQRQYPEIGGLMSYGTNVTDSFRQVGVYAGQILKGAKPADLPVVQATKFELVINAQTARMLGLTVPASLLAIADEVIE
jgi:putative ABC transport system substrate-binding protein